VLIIITVTSPPLNLPYKLTRLSWLIFRDNWLRKTKFPYLILIFDLFWLFGILFIFFYFLNKECTSSLASGKKREREGNAGQCPGKLVSEREDGWSWGEFFEVGQSDGKLVVLKKYILACAGYAERRLVSLSEDWLIWRRSLYDLSCRLNHQGVFCFWGIVKHWFFNVEKYVNKSRGFFKNKP